MSSQTMGDSSPRAFIDAMLNCAWAYPASRSPRYCFSVAASGQLMTEYADTRSLRCLAHATWSARHGLAWKPGPLVSPMRTYWASSAGIGAPVEILCGIPIPAGHCGQETSPPITPGARGASGFAMPLASAWAEAASDCAAEARSGSMPPPAVVVGVAGAGLVGAAGDVGEVATEVGAVGPLGDGSVTVTGCDVLRPVASSTAEASAAAARITASPTPRRATRSRR